ncbi:hypothetical protein ACIBF1_33925 [Spirillospora sp. NPDC050679]
MGSDDAPMAALAEVLGRRCLGEQLPGDGDTAERLMEIVTESGPDPELLEVTAALVGPAAAGPRTAERLDALRETARGLLQRPLTTTEQFLVVVSLGLLAEETDGARSPRHHVTVALAAVRIEQDRLARWAAERALDAAEELNPGQETAAWLVLALITQDRAVIERAFRYADALAPDDPRAEWARSLRPTLWPDPPDPTVADAVRAGDRRTAVTALARDFAQTIEETGDPVVKALHTTLLAMADPAPDVAAARQGLHRLVTRLRERRRFGHMPDFVKAGIDMVSDLLQLEADPASADVLAELVEALADAGLTEVVLPREAEVPVVAQARLAAAAAAHPVWPDLRACVDGLRGRPALLLRRQRTFAVEHGSVLSLYLEPPDSVAIKSAFLTPEDGAALAAFGSGRPAAIAKVPPADLDRMVGSLLPAALLEDLAAGGVESLLVVPDGDLWSVPWQSAAPFRGVPVSVAPSMSVYRRLPPFDGKIGSITAFVDGGAPSADAVLTALDAARAAGTVVRPLSAEDPPEPCDLLLVYAHGTGRGLDFRTGTADWPLSALDVTRTGPARSALIAVCGSAAAPPVSFPINLPVAMLLERVPLVVGALWPLPHETTSRLVTDVITRIAAGERLLPAFEAARGRAPGGLLDRGGLAVHGVV